MRRQDQLSWHVVPASDRLKQNRFQNRVPNVLFLSKRNSLRSQLAEATLRKVGGSTFKAYSCGVPVHISPDVSPVAVATLQKAGISTEGLYPKSWSEFAKFGPSKMDYVIALDEALAHLHPAWPGQPEVALWNYPDIDQEKAPLELQLPQTTKMLLSMQYRLELLVGLCAKVRGRREMRDDLRDLGRSY